MKKIAKFEKISYEIFENAMMAFCPEIKNVKKIYEEIKLPRRERAGVAGYDFFAPFNIKLKPNQTIMIPSGIKCEMLANWVLVISPRSSMGFKYRLQLDNTVGIIDSNIESGHTNGQIIIKITNDSKEKVIAEIRKGQGFVQGVFLEYGITYDDNF
jgi:dUTP pyrophosphatase